MTIKLYYHPLSSYCHKVLIALYENKTPFEPVLVDLGDPASRAAFLAVWPIGKFPVIEDVTRGIIVPESSIVIEYLAQHYPGPSVLVPDAPDKARDVRLYDRFFDHYLQTPMQKVMGDVLRPEGAKDPFGVEQAFAQLRVALGLVEQRMETMRWATGDEFTMADCSAAPALFYANRLVPLATSFPHTDAYLTRLKERPSYRRTLEEAEPYFQFIPR